MPRTHGHAVHDEAAADLGHRRVQEVHRTGRRAASGHHRVRISGRIPQRGHVRIEGVPHAPHLEHNATHPPDPRGQLRTKCITHLPHLRHPRLDELVAEQQHGHTRGTAHLDLVDSRGGEQAGLAHPASEALAHELRALGEEIGRAHV